MATNSTRTESPVISSAELRRDLTDCYAASGDEIATVYLPTVSTTVAADERFEIQLKNVRSRLTDAQASPGLVERTIDTLRAHEHTDGDAVLVVATEESVLLDHVMVRPVDRLTVAVGPTPLLLPIMAATQIDEPHLAVLLDRTGADVYQRDGVGAPIDSMDVDGDAVRVHRGHPGGWSQRRFQQTAENAWESNARDVMEAIIEEYGLAQPVVIAGDERAVGFFDQHLPSATERIVVAGSRHADHAAFLDEVDEMMRSRAATSIVDLLDTFRSRLGAGSGATGEAVLDALSRGQVEHLLVENDSLHPSRQTGRFDFTVPMHRLDADHGPSTIAPVTDSAVALALATGADVTVVPASLPDLEMGLGALSRF